MKNELSPKQRDDLLAALKARFDANKARHPGLVWAKVQARLEASPDKLWSLAEMDRMAAPKKFQRERWDGDGFGPQFGERPAQAREVRGVGEDGEVGVAAKLGRAVEHARLSAHEQGADAVRAHRRKDFAYRVRNQVSLPARGRSARVSRFPASVAQA